MRRGKGFTLTELLVVISVIALLMVLGRVRKQGRTLACRSNLCQGGLSLHNYAAANDGQPLDQSRRREAGRLAQMDEEL